MQRVGQVGPQPEFHLPRQAAGQARAGHVDGPVDIPADPVEGEPLGEQEAELVGQDRAVLRVRLAGRPVQGLTGQADGLVQHGALVVGQVTAERHGGSRAHQAGPAGRAFGLPVEERADQLPCLLDPGFVPAVAVAVPQDADQHFLPPGALRGSGQRGPDVPFRLG